MSPREPLPDQNDSGRRWNVKDGYDENTERIWEPRWAESAGPDRVAPRECIRAARNALNTAYSHPGITSANHALTFIAEAVDWQRRALEQMVPDASDQFHSKTEDS